MCSATNIVGTGSSRDITLSVVVCKYDFTNYCNLEFDLHF